MSNAKSNQGFFAKLRAFAKAVDAVASAPAPVAAPARQAAAPANRAKTQLALAPKTAAKPVAAPKADELVLESKAAEATEAERSSKRIAIIADHLHGRIQFAEMLDNRFMYRVTAEEHAYQAARLKDLKERVRFARGQAAVEMAEDINATTAVVEHLYTVLKRLVAPRAAAC